MISKTSPAPSPSPLSSAYSPAYRTNYMNQRMVKFHSPSGVPQREQYCNALNVQVVALPPRSAKAAASVAEVTTVYGINLRRDQIHRNPYEEGGADRPPLPITRMKCGSMAFCGPVLYYQGSPVAHNIRISPTESVLLMRRAYRAERGWQKHADMMQRAITTQHSHIQRGVAPEHFQNKVTAVPTHNLAAMYHEGNLEEFARRTNQAVDSVVAMLKQAQTGQAHPHLAYNLTTYMANARHWWHLLKHALDLRIEAQESRLEQADTYPLLEDTAAAISRAEATMQYVPPPLLDYQMLDNIDERISALVNAEAIIALERS